MLETEDNSDANDLICDHVILRVILDRDEATIAFRI